MVGTLSRDGTTNITEYTSPNAMKAVSIPYTKAMTQLPIDLATTYLRAEFDAETIRGATALGAKVATDVPKKAPRAMESSMVDRFQTQCLSPRTSRRRMRCYNVKCDVGCKQQESLISES